jgi:hypothetical protein
MTTKPEAKRLAEILFDMTAAFNLPSMERGVLNGAAAELRRQHAEIERLQAERDALKAELSTLHRNYRGHVETISRWTFAMQAALIEGRTNSAESGLRWIANTLAGPGLLPSSLATDDQAWFDDKLAEYEEWERLHPIPHQDKAPDNSDAAISTATGAAA